MNQPLHIRSRTGLLECATFLLLVAAAPGQRTLPPMPVSKPAPEPTMSDRFKGLTGLVQKQPGVSDGYVMVATKEHPSFYLIDTDGRIVKEWTMPCKTSLPLYLLPNGNILRTIRSLDGEVGDFVEESTWDGEVVWEYRTDRTVQRIHHDVERMPNGNTLVTVWERKSPEEYLAVGRNPDTVANDEMWVDAIYEVKPTGREGGEVVWRWSPWDHLVQDFDETKENYGNPAEHPTRIDVNQVRTSKEFPRLSDWLHVNSITYNAERDEIMVSVQALSEIWVVSRKTGEIVYRYGNPSRYGRGEPEEAMLYSQHDAHWIPAGLRGAGNLLIFNNEAGYGAGDGQYSTALEVVPPLTASGDWPVPTEKGYPPAQVVWSFSGGAKTKFYSKVVSNIQRLSNGNTLICVGAKGLILEIDAADNVLWSYCNPVFRVGPEMKKLEKWHSGPPAGGNLLFRAYKYPPDYPAFAGKELVPGRLLKEVADEEWAAQAPQPE